MLTKVVKFITIFIVFIFFPNALIAANVSILNKNDCLIHNAALTQAVGQMMMVGFNGTQINQNSPIVQEIKRYHVGAIILDRHKNPGAKKFTTNIENPEQLKQLITQLQFYAKKYQDYPLFIAINQEGGLINTLKPTLGFDTKNDLSQAELGKISDQTFIFDKTYQRGLLLYQLGINLDLAPVADLNINPENPAIGKLARSFGNNPDQVTQDLASAIQAYREANILCTLKHFPGLGSANAHTDYSDNVDVTQTWKPEELLPYENLIQAGQACPLIMISHLINKKLDNSGLPASLSKQIITDLLINKLHYQGLIITDDMDATAIRKNLPTEFAIKKAVLAGNDIIIYGGTQGHDPDQDTRLLFNRLMKLAKQDPAICQRVLESASKITTVKKNFFK